MVRITRTVILLLIAQLIAGPSAGVWGQGLRGFKPGVRSPGDLQGTIRRGAPAGKVGVKSAVPFEEKVPGGQALSRAVVPDEYILGPGDGLTVTLWGEYDDTYVVAVTPDGKISLPTIGVLKVTGLSLVQAENLINTEVKRFYRNVNSGLSLTSLRVFQVLVLGEVLKPGTYLATPVKRVSEVIDQAGGVQPGGSQREIQLKRNGRVFSTVDLAGFFRNVSEFANPFLRDGDVIYVPPMGDMRVWIYLSEANSQSGGGARGLRESLIPYLVEIREGDRLSSVITAVGGVSPWWELESVFVEREMNFPKGTLTIPLNLRSYFLENDETQNVVLESGDHIYIPSSVRRVVVGGAVNAPGVFVYLPGKSAEDYLLEAGGPKVTAELSRSFIKRVDGSVEPYIGTVELNNGDTIVILERIFKTWTDYVALVGTITGFIFTGVGIVAIFNQ